MDKKNEIKIFEDKQVRTVWDAEQEIWFVSIVDVISILTESVDPNAYWRKLKQRLKAEGNVTVTNCHSLNMLAEASTKDISAVSNPKDFEESKKVAKQGGNVAKVARLELEAKTGKKVVSSLNTKDTLKALPDNNTSKKRNSKE